MIIVTKLNFDLLKNKVTMNELLIDSEGFPRSDIDVYSIRTARQKIICLRNDLHTTTQELHQALVKMHQEKDFPLTLNPQTTFGAPFSIVKSVVDHSPAFKAGFMVNDRIIKYGNVHHQNHDSLKALSLETLSHQNVII